MEILRPKYPDPSSADCKSNRDILAPILPRSFCTSLLQSSLPPLCTTCLYHYYPVATWDAPQDQWLGKLTEVEARQKAGGGGGGKLAMPAKRFTTVTVKYCKIQAPGSNKARRKAMRNRDGMPVSRLCLICTDT